MIHYSDFRIDAGQQEIVPMEEFLFPYACVYSDLNEKNARCDWHWHSTFEINTVLEGEGLLQTSNGQYTVRAGESVFVNSGILHKFCTAKGDAVCFMTQHIAPSLIAGNQGSAIEQKYVQPILQNRNLEAFQILPDGLSKIQMMEKIMECIHLAEDEPRGFEIDIRGKMCEFWMLLLSETEELRRRKPIYSELDTDRVKQMVGYIQYHFCEHITAKDIADACNISVRESARCFGRRLGTTPVSYLNDYRIRMAARMLLHTDYSVLEIGEECGFSSGSYFGKTFREAMGCTPKEYRAGKARREEHVLQEMPASEIE